MWSPGLETKDFILHDTTYSTSFLFVLISFASSKGNTRVQFRQMLLQ